MTRILVTTTSFRKKSHKFLKKHPELEDKVNKIFLLLKIDVFSPKLSTHKLHGDLGTLYGCTIVGQYRIVFYFDDKEVFLLSIGNHNDSY